MSAAAAPQPASLQANPDRVGHRGGVDAGGVAPGPDRPDRLIGDHEAARERLLRLDVGERTAHLPIDHVDGPTSLAVGQLLADAQDRSKPSVECPGDLPGDQRVGLAGVPPALGMADDHPGREADQHRRRDLAGVRPGQLVMDVLGTDRDVGIRLRQRVAHRTRDTHTADRSRA